MTKTFIPVAQYRDQIDFAYDAINSHWNACVGDNEQVKWFISAFNKFDSLSKIDCKRANIDDRQRYEAVFDLFSRHCDKYFFLWLKARLESGRINYDQYKSVLQIGFSTTQ